MGGSILSVKFSRYSDQDWAYLLATPPLRWVSFPRKTLVSFNYKSIDDTEMLKVLLDVLVDHPDHYNDGQRNELIAKANMMTPSILAGTTSRADVSKEWIKIASAVVGASALMGPLGIGAGITAINVWLAKSIADREKKPKKDKR